MKYFWDSIGAEMRTIVTWFLCVAGLTVVIATFVCLIALLPHKG